MSATLAWLEAGPTARKGKQGPHLSLVTRITYKPGTRYQEQTKTNNRIVLSIPDGYERTSTRTYHTYQSVQHSYNTNRNNPRVLLYPLVQLLVFSLSVIVEKKQRYVYSYEKIGIWNRVQWQAPHYSLLVYNSLCSRFFKDDVPMTSYSQGLLVGFSASRSKL